MERIPADSFRDHPDHTRRYEYAATKIGPGESVNDIACGVGYGATFLPHAVYTGYDKPGVPDARFPGARCDADLDDPSWEPFGTDVTVCFETLEHVKDPARLAAVIARTTRRAIILSVPLYPHEENPFHLATFTVEEIPPMFPGFRVAEDWPQPEARGHVWLLERDDSA